MTAAALGRFNVGDLAIGHVIDANIRQDLFPGGRLHYKAHATGFGAKDRIRAKTKKYTEKKLAKAQKAAHEGNLDEALKQIGKGLHAIQDLIAHEDFPNLLDNLSKLDEHSENDHDPSPEDREESTRASARYFGKLWDSLSEEQQKELVEMCSPKNDPEDIPEW